MPELPKLKLKIPHWHGDKELIRDFEEAKRFFSSWGGVVAVDGQVVNSYEELVKLASQEPYKHKEFLEVTVIGIIGGG